MCELYKKCEHVIEVSWQTKRFNCFNLYEYFRRQSVTRNTRMFIHRGELAKPDLAASKQSVIGRYNPA